MPADGISLPLKRGTSARPAGPGLKVRLHQPRDWAEGGMTASDFNPGNVRFGSLATEEVEAARRCMSALPPKADIDGAAGMSA